MEYYTRHAGPAEARGLMAAAEPAGPESEETRRPMREVVQDKVRHYEFQNLNELDLPMAWGGSEDDRKQARARGRGFGQFFEQTTRYCTAAVVDESVIDNGIVMSTDLMRALDPRFVESIFQQPGVVRAAVYMPEQVLCREGDKAEAMVVVSKGEVRATKESGDGNLNLTEGMVFGELAFLGEQPKRTHTLTAGTFCDVRLVYTSAWENTLALAPSSQEKVRQACRTYSVRRRGGVDLDVASNQRSQPLSAKEERSLQQLVRSASSAHMDNVMVNRKAKAAMQQRMKAAFEKQERESQDESPAL